MNIQIFGKSKCFDTQKALRHFKERRVKYQYVDLLKYGMSKGELGSVRAAVGGLECLMDKGSKLYEGLNMGRISTASVREEILLSNPALLVTPIVRNGKKATVGYAPDVWKDWERHHY